MKKILVLAPHGDDEVLGCGGAILKHLEAGDYVTVAFIKAPYDDRSFLQQIQTQESQNVLGYQQKIFLNLSELDFFKKAQFIEKIENLIKETEPETIYSTFFGDLHQDHRALFDALNSAARIYQKHRVDNILLYETPSSTDQGLYKNIFPFTPNLYIPLSYTHIMAKVEALRCYTEEIKESPHPRSIENIIDVAKLRGREIGEEYAEAFYTIRIIQK